jgi:hypothetical protein
MNKLVISVVIIALVVVAYLMLAPKKANAPMVNTSSVSGTIEHSEESKQVDEQLAAAASSLISTAPENADVFILEPGNGTTVSSPVTVKFGITNMQVAPAGSDVENSGHHHLLIDLDTLPDLTQPLPATEQLIHFGGGQTETTIELEPGEHTLQLLLGNYLHIPHDPPVVSKKITITVE